MVDWELCTLGDPLADVGLLMAYWPERGEAPVALGQPANLAPGFPTRQELAARYAERSGRDLSQLDFFVALGYWKLAIILEGVYARYAAGPTARCRRASKSSRAWSSGWPRRPSGRSVKTACRSDQTSDRGAGYDEATALPAQ